MISLKNILLEGLMIYRIEVLIKTVSQENQVYIYNQIRGLQGVVVVTIEQSDFLRAKSNKKVQYELLKMKFLAEKEPADTIKNIKVDALVKHKIPGLIQFIPRLKTIEKVGEY
jgi:hypothetical protein